MGSSGSAPETSIDDAETLFSRLEGTCTPLSTEEVAAELDCEVETAAGTLETLVDREQLRTRELDGGTRVWWQPGPQTGSTEDAGQTAGSDEPGTPAEVAETPQPSGVEPSATGNRSDAEERSVGEAEFRSFVEDITDYAIFVLDPDGTVASWNEGAERIKGYTTEEIVGEHFSTFYTDADVDEGVPESNLAKAAEAGRVEDEGWRVRADGTEFWANVVITAIRDEDGDLRGFTKVTRDMTERREYEQQLRRERDVTERVLETVPVSIGVLDEDARFVRANSRMLERHGIDEADLGEYSISSLDVYDTDGEPISQDDWPIQQVFESGEPVYDFQCQVAFSADDRQWLSINAAPLETDRDEDDRIVVAVTDVTEHKERELELRRERDQTEQLLRTVPVTIAVQNSDGETVLANRRAQETLGLTEAEFHHAPSQRDEWTVYDPDGDVVEPAETPTARVLASGEPVFDEEIVVDPPEDEPVTFRVNAAPVLDEDGDIDRVVTAAEDVTELRRRQRELERRKTELETELSEVLGRISDAFYALDDQWRFTHLNDRAAELFDCDREELLGEILWERFPDADDVYREQFDRAMATQDPVSFEVYAEEVGAWLEFNVYPSETGLSVYFRDVTDRKERVRELERYETLFTESTDVNAVLDPDGTFQYLPPSVENVLGYEADELVGEDTFANVHPDDRERIAAEFQRMVEEPDYQPTNEFRYRHADGHWVWLESTGRNLLDDPSIEGLVAYTRDITDRKERERTLRERERQFQAIFEDPNILVGLLDPDGTVRDINGTAMDYVDADLAAVRDEPFWETPWWGASDDVRADVREWVERAADGEYVDFQADLTRPDGTEYTIEGVFRPVTDEDGEVVSVIVSDRDVTERKEHERQLSRLMDNVPGMVYRCRNERGWPMSFVSDACEDVTGYDPAAVERDDVNWDGDVIVEEDRDMVWEEIQAAFADGETFSVTYRIETADGERRWVRDLGRGVVEDGQVVEIEGIIADITDRKRLEDELQESERRYRTIAEYFPNGIVTLFDDDLRYELAAGQGFADIPVSAADLEDAHVDEAWDEETADALQPLFQDALDGEEQSVELEYMGRHWVVRAVPITDEYGDVVAGMTMAQDVTERVERERELSTYETIVETVDDGIYVKDEDGQFTMVNEGYADLTGYDEDDLVGEHASLVVDEEAMETSTDLEGADNDEPKPVMEASIRRADGGTVPAEATFGSFETADGEEMHVGVVRDVSERKERERALEKSERRYRTLAENFPNGAVGVYDEDLQYTLAAGAKLGADLPSAAELEGRRMPDIFPPDTAADLEPLFRAAIEDGVTDSTTTEFGGRNWRVWAAPLVDSDGEIYGGLSLAQDVTEELERKRTLERYETIVETVNDGVYVVDDAGQFTMVNEAYADMLEYDPADLVGEEVSTVVDTSVHERAQALEANMKTGTDSGEQPTLEADLVSASGDRVPAEANFALLPEGDETWHRVGVVRDVSERKERQRKLEESERRYRTLAENFPQGAVGMFDENLEYTAVGGQLLEDVGVDTDERVGNSVYDIYPDELVEDIEQYFQAALQGEANTFEVEFHGRYLDAHTLPVTDADDEIIAGMLVVRDVTERRDARRELRQSEAKFRMIAENLDEIVWMATGDASEFRYLNPTFERVWGMDRDRLYDDPLAFLETVHEDDRERVRRQFEALPEEPFDDEFRIVRPDGEIRWVHARGERVAAEDGEMVRVVGIGKDITGRVQRERELGRALGLLERTERIADVGGWEIDVDTQDVFWTDHIFDLLEVPGDEEPPLDEALSMYRDEDQRLVEEAVENALAEGESFDFEVRIETNSGEERWLRLQGVPEVEAGEVVSLRGAAQDVTERVLRERELERALDLLEKAEQIADVAGWEVDPETEEPYWSDHLFDLLDVDYDHQPTLDQALDVYETDEDRAAVENAVEEALETGESFDIVVEFPRPQGDVGQLRVQGAPEVEDGEVVSLRGAVQDVTEQVERERQLEELVEQLEESNKRLEQFAYAASHDLQEPLRMVSSYLQLIESRYADEFDEDGREFLEFAVDGADRMREMIDGLLAYSRVDTRGDPFEQVDLQEALGDARDDLQVKIDEHDAEISVEDLPSVTGDPGQLRQLFQNLLDNAIDYSGDEPPRIHVGAERVGDAWEISVRDEGIGMEPDDADQIFEVFQTLHTREEHGGTGIGLALCERIVERHGGDIRVESEPGEGSTFTFTLPVGGETDG